MKNIRFVTAVLLATQSLRQKPFSVFNVTDTLRKQVNAGEISFSDRSPETVDGIGTFRVDHNEVKAVFQELFKEKVIGGLTPKNMGSYVQYSCDAGSSAKFSPRKAFDNFVSLVSGPKYNVTKNEGTLTKASPTVNPPSSLQHRVVKDKVQDYISGRIGTLVTLKEIQSRFKGIYLTCETYAKICEELGFKIEKPGSHVSKWFIEV